MQALLLTLILLLSSRTTEYNHCTPIWCGGTAPADVSTPAWRNCYSTMFGKHCDLFFTNQAGLYARVWEYAGADAYMNNKTVDCDLAKLYPNLAKQSREYDGVECYAAAIANAAVGGN